MADPGPPAATDAGADAEAEAQAAADAERHGLDLLRRRVLLALELVADPAVAPFRRRCLGVWRQPGVPRSDAAEARRQLSAMLAHVWDLMNAAYGVELGKDFHAVHHARDPLNCVMLSPDAKHADRVVEWWSGPGEVVRTTVTAVETTPEYWIRVPVSLAWDRPHWLS